MDRIKQILLFILGLAVIVGLLFVFFYIFIFLLIIGLIYYLYRRFFKRKKVIKVQKDETKKINPVIIDMDE